MILAKRCLHVSPTPTRCTPVCLSTTFRLRNINARHAVQGGLPLAYNYTKVSTLVRSLLLFSQNFRSHPCSASKSVPPGPELPESLCATYSTASSVILTEIKIGVYSYVYNVAQEGTVLLGCFPSKPDATVLLIVPVRSSTNSSG